MKRTLSFIMAIIMLVALCACGQSNSIEEPTAPVQNDVASAPETQTSDKAPSAVPNEEIHTTQDAPPSEYEIKMMETYSLDYVSESSYADHAFYNGVAWATIVDDSTGEKKLGVINKHGELLYLLYETRFATNINSIKVTPFLYGLSLVNYQYIIDTDGNEVYEFSDPNVKVVGYCYDDGSIFLSKHTPATFSTSSSDQLCIITSDLELLETGVEITKTIERNYTIRKLANNFYCVCMGGYSILINLSNKTFFYVGSGLLSFNTDYALMDTSGHYYLVPISELAKTTSYDEVFDLEKSNSSLYIAINDASGGVASGFIAVNLNNGGSVWPDEFYVKTNTWAFTTFKNASFFREVVGGGKNSGTHYYEYIDLNGNTLVRFPTYPDGVAYRSWSDYSGGYCGIWLKGIDEAHYVTILDEQGVAQYVPKKFYGFGSFNGYIFGYDENLDNLCMLSPNGDIKQFGDELYGISNTDRYSYYSNTLSYAISDGYIFLNCQDTEVPVEYVAVDGSAIIDKVYEKINYDGYLIYTEDSGEKRIGGKVIIADDANETEPSNQTQAVSKDYISTSSFTIEGKWKNNGTYTYGQAQSGAIAAFDGTHCNIVSPQDTYAFYKNGDNWRLDCTTLLGDTLSFTVKIVDENHIDIYNGSNYLEMARVE